MLRGLECCNAFLPTRRNATDGCFERMLFRDKRKKLVVPNLAYSAKSAYLCSHQREGRYDHRASLISKYARSGCSTVGSAPRSGRGGRKFESSHPDNSCLQVICRQLFLCRHIVCLDEYREWTPKISGETRKASPLCIYG